VSRRHTIVSKRDLDRPRFEELVGKTYDDGRVLGVEVQRDRWVALVEHGNNVHFVPCAVVAEALNENDGAELPDAAKQGRIL